MKNRMNQRLVAVVLGLSMALAACKGGKPFPTEESSVGGKMTETGSGKNSPSEAKKQEEGTIFDREETPMVGGWSINKGHFSPEENKDAMKAFHKAINGLTGYYYEVVAVLGSQVVAGTNYAYLGRGNVVVPDAEPTYLILYVYENLIGKARILGSQSIFTGDLEGVSGDFSLNTGKTELQENAAVSAAFEKAVANLAGVSYEPIAYLGLQAVDGEGPTYAVLCLEKVGKDSTQTKLSIVTVYGDLGGKAKIRSTEDVELGLS